MFEGIRKLQLKAGLEGSRPQREEKHREMSPTFGTAFPLQAFTNS